MGLIKLTIGSAVHARELGEDWNPQCHWIIQPDEPIEAEFVQGILDKYLPQIKAYAISEALGGYCVELQFTDAAIGKQCNQEYARGWRKGGAVATKKRAANKPPTKRLQKNRMYILPDGTEFLYFNLWDRHGNLVGKVLTDAGYVVDENGFIPIENKIIHRSIVEQGTLVPKGEERFQMG